MPPTVPSFSLLKDEEKLATNQDDFDTDFYDFQPTVASGVALQREGRRERK